MLQNPNICKHQHDVADKKFHTWTCVMGCSLKKNASTLILYTIALRLYAQDILSMFMNYQLISCLDFALIPI